MVIEFPTVDLGGTPSTEEGAPEDGAAFSSLVEELLAEEPASPDDIETDSADPNDLPLVDAAVLFIVPPPIVNVPAPNVWASGEGTFDGPAEAADHAAESVTSPATAADPNAVVLGAFASVVKGAESLPPSSPPAPSLFRPELAPLVPPESASATLPTPPTLPASPAPAVDASAASGPGLAAPEPLFPQPSAVPASGDVAEEGPQAPTLAPTANASQLVVPEADPPGTGDASHNERTARKDGRGYFERFSDSASGVVPADAGAVQRAGALVELGLDLGSSARDGSRDGGATSASSHGAAVPVVLAGTTGTATSVAAPSAAWMPASQADDAVLPQLVRAMRLQLVGGVGEARIQLEPEHLGAVTVNLRVESGVVSAVVTAEQSAVRQWIESHETSLRQALAEQGLVLGKLHVERDGRPPGERSSQGQDDTPRRRSPRKDTATFELLA